MSFSIRHSLAGRCARENLETRSDLANSRSQKWSWKWIASRSWVAIGSTGQSGRWPCWRWFASHCLGSPCSPSSRSSRSRVAVGHIRIPGLYLGRGCERMVKTDFLCVQQISFGVRQIRWRTVGQCDNRTARVKEKNRTKHVAVNRIQRSGVQSPAAVNRLEQPDQFRNLAEDPCNQCTRKRTYFC